MVEDLVWSKGARDPKYTDLLYEVVDRSRFSKYSAFISWKIAMGFDILAVKKRILIKT